MNRIAWTLLILILTLWLLWTLSGMWHRVTAINTTLRADRGDLVFVANQWLDLHQKKVDLQAIAANPTIEQIARTTAIPPATLQRTRLVLILYPKGIPDDRPVPIGWTAGLRADGYWETTPYPRGGFLLMSDRTVAYRDGGRDVEYLLRRPDGTETPDPLQATAPDVIQIPPPDPHPQ